MKRVYAHKVHLTNHSDILSPAAFQSSYYTGPDRKTEGMVPLINSKAEISIFTPHHHHIDLWFKFLHVKIGNLSPI